MNLNASCGNHNMGLFRAFKSLLRRPSQRPFYVVGRLGRGKKARVGRWNSISSHRPLRASCFFLLLLLGCLCGPVINSAFGRRCRKVVSRGREDTTVWYRNDVLRNGFIWFSRGALHGYFLYLVFIFRVRSIGKSGFRICNRTRNPENRFPCWEVCFWISFLPRIVLQILFRISQSIGKKEIPEIRIWIS